MGLKKIYRLKKQTEIQRVFDSKNVFFGKFFIIKYCANDLKFSKFGIVSSTKSFPKAVERNRVRRRMREIIRKNFENIKPGIDVLFIMKRPALDAEFQDLKLNTLKGLNFLKLLKK